MINCDLGESESDARTRALLELVDAASICCGAHAGDPGKTRRALQIAAALPLRIGAHPGLSAEGGRGAALPDRTEFSRLLHDQLGFFFEAADQVGCRVDYIKLHGSLYHAVESDAGLAQVYLDHILALPEPPGIFALAGGSMARRARAVGVQVWAEGFADRAYRPNGHLVSRSEPCAVLGCEAALERFSAWRNNGEMQSVDGTSFPLQVDTFCVHSDSKDALSLLRGLKDLSVDCEHE